MRVSGIVIAKSAERNWWPWLSVGILAALCTVLALLQYRWTGEIANAERFSVPLAQVSPRAVAEAAIGGMLAGKRSVVPGIVPRVVSTGGRFVPRSLLLPAMRIGNRFRGGPSA